MTSTYTTPGGTSVTLRYTEVEAHGKVPTYHEIIATGGGHEKVGYLRWRDRLPKKEAGMIMDIKVELDFQNQGIATAMYEAAKGTGHAIRHSDSRTLAGEAWARSTGDPVPLLRERVTGYRAGQMIGSRDRPKKLPVVRAFSMHANRYPANDEAADCDQYILDVVGPGMKVSSVFSIEASQALGLAKWIVAQEEEEGKS